MSVDLNDPEIQRLQREVLDPSSQTTWFLTHYDPSTSSVLVPLASGSSPSISRIRDTLASTTEELVYGYADVQGKGLIIVYMIDGINGVRRARAVVHSRAFATLFQDYSALITISTASELTDELVADKLGLPEAHDDRSSRMTGLVPVSSGHPNPSDLLEPTRSVSSSGQGATVSNDGHLTDTSTAQFHTPTSGAQMVLPPSPPPELGPPLDLESSRAPPQDHYSRSIEDSARPNDPATFPTQPTSINPQLQRDLALAAGHTEPEASLPPASMIGDDPSHPSNITPSGQPAPLPLADRLQIHTVSPLSDRLPPPSEPTVIHPDRPLDPKGISSTDVFPEQRNRKTSLSSRLGSLGAAFGRGSSTSPKSPSVTVFTPTDSNGHNGSPRDDQSPSTRSNKSPGSPGKSRFFSSQLVKNFGRRVSGNSTHTSSPPTTPRIDERAAEDADAPPPLPPKDSTPSPRRFGSGHEPAPGAHYGTGQNYIGTLPLSPQADGRSRPSSAGRGDGGGISPSPSAKLAMTAASQKSVKTEMEIQERVRKDMELRDQERLADQHDFEQNVTVIDRGSHLEDGEEEEGLPYDRPDPREPPLSVNDRAPEKEAAPHQGLSPSELEQATGVKEKMTELSLAEAGVAGPGVGLVAGSLVSGQAADDGDRRMKEEEERLKAEEQRVAQEEERVAEERERLAQEEKRVAEERARLDREEEELRVKEEQEHFAREEQARWAEEERLRKIEEERRIQAEKEAEEQRLKAEQEELERQRKAQVRESMVRGKQNGGIMLSGWITVQTMKSPTWRRRHFNLYKDKLDLFKSEVDPAPIQTIHLGNDAKVSHTYEESQVQESFKITAGDGEPYFLFTDGHEDRETVLEGLALAMERA
ncbi:hypothetical protein BD324DRAFT_635239 [Kockovaella imperatae]|uniref:ADF-H domain-containing protein n=1 Tax=Kockovaella imperatae TaxID=4999 RepID=A0A1Y1UCP3_9TREE|nr:hypothetical protein BD324DRAFT_635239 [Kockovaella imperatae]ORX34835.1 hypothetical protein BD324DRAFT_635239 [Kockovaella imperatae]